MSKSLGNILDPIEIIDKYGIDQLRYYLTKEVSLGNDGSISMSNLTNCINNDLANNYGNLCQRVFSFIKKNCDNKFFETNKKNELDEKLISNLKNKIPGLVELINKQNLNEYLKTVINFSFEANKYFNDSEPWSIKNSDKERMNAILFTILEQIKNISILLSPIIPISTQKVLTAMNIPNKDVSLKSISEKTIANYGKNIADLDILFKKIEHDN